MKGNPNIIGSRISTERFTYNKKSLEFVAEMSELCHGGANPLGQLYADACDQGFVLISEKTNQAAEFTLHDTQRDADGDVRYWELVPTQKDIFYNPKLKDVKIIILND